jgi:hypothetical protein
VTEPRRREYGRVKPTTPRVSWEGREEMRRALVLRLAQTWIDMILLAGGSHYTAYTVAGLWCQGLLPEAPS